LGMRLSRTFPVVIRPFDWIRQNVIGSVNRLHTLPSSVPLPLGKFVRVKCLDVKSPSLLDFLLRCIRSDAECLVIVRAVVPLH